MLGGEGTRRGGMSRVVAADLAMAANRLVDRLEGQDPVADGQRRPNPVSCTTTGRRG